jgi:hypothetical protein
VIYVLKKLAKYSSSLFLKRTIMRFSRPTVYIAVEVTFVVKAGDSSIEYVIITYAVTIQETTTAEETAIYVKRNIIFIVK